MAETAGDAPTTRIARARLEAGVALLELVVETGLAPSRSAAKRVITQGGISVRGLRPTPCEPPTDWITITDPRFWIRWEGCDG